MNTNENKNQIGKSEYESPVVNRVQIQTEGGFAASQSVIDNSASEVSLGTWTKTNGTDSDTWSDQ